MLRPYIPGNPELIPFVKGLPKDSTSFQAGDPKGAKGKVGAAVDAAADKLKELKP